MENKKFLLLFALCLVVPSLQQTISGTLDTNVDLSLYSNSSDFSGMYILFWKFNVSVAQPYIDFVAQVKTVGWAGMKNFLYPFSFRFLLTAKMKVLGYLVTSVNYCSPISITCNYLTNKKKDNPMTNTDIALIHPSGNGSFQG